jgi:haloalkane dehalogenase
VRGLAFMEFIRPIELWDDFHQTEVARETFRKLRTPAVGEQMVLEANAFVERVLPGSIVRQLDGVEMAAYRAPFPTPESRRPILTLPRELPISGEPADVHEMLSGNPGALVSPSFAENFAASLKHCAVVQLGEGRHYLQEDHPEAIGRSIAVWVAGIEAAMARYPKQAA